ncbi:MAG: hypothetical protein KatS3mg110_0495 [Pirellulaceae bacterium]|nr:MAG: hypothetical protein KatS3mg110_0495 [Pirellulaceae bacterium]
MDEFLARRFEFPDCRSKKVLVLGLGGGCDIILAYAISTIVAKTQPERVIYANTKIIHDISHLPEVTTYIRRVSHERKVLSGPGRRRTHGTTRIDESVPRGDEGCPWIFLLSDDRADQELVKDIVNLDFDLLVGIDTGGDSLVEVRSSFDNQRDRRMLRVLFLTGLPVLHVIVAPGSDGEASFEELQRAFAEQCAKGRFQGTFDLEELLPVLRTLSEPLSEDRTPRIILAAAEDRLPRAGQEMVVVPRGCHPTVPRAWLTRAFVFGDA